MAGIFVKKDISLLLNVDYMEAYIPEHLFKKGLNEELGDKVSLLGIFNFKIGKGPDKLDNKIHTFHFPSMIVTAPSSIDTEEFELIKGTGVQRYKVLKYYKGNAVMESLHTIADIGNVEKFVNLLLEAALPNTLPIPDVKRLFLQNIIVNKQSLGISDVALSAMVSEIYRYKNDMSIPFRKMYGAGKAGELDYQAANARVVSANNGTFSGLIFEDQDTMLVSAVNKKRYNKKENESPLEKIIRV